MLYLGIDEAGVGTWAGPEIVAGCIIEDHVVKGVKDSKKLNKTKIQSLALEIKQKALWYKVVMGWHDEIDTFGLGRVWDISVQHILASALPAAEEFKVTRAIIDGARRVKVWRWITRSVPKADTKIYPVSAASILAKDAQIRVMQNIIHKEFPMYGFAQHCGYGTDIHKKTLNKFGPCVYHRWSISPLAKFGKPVRPAPVVGLAKAEEMVQKIAKFRFEGYDVVNAWEREFVGDVGQMLLRKETISENQMNRLRLLYNRTQKFSK